MFLNLWSSGSTCLVKRQVFCGALRVSTAWIGLALLFLGVFWSKVSSKPLCSSLQDDGEGFSSMTVKALRWIHNVLQLPFPDLYALWVTNQNAVPLAPSSANLTTMSLRDVWCRLSGNNVLSAPPFGHEPTYYHMYICVLPPLLLVMPWCILERSLVLDPIPGPCFLR